MGKSFEEVYFSAILAKTPCPSCKENTMQMTGMCLLTSPGMYVIKCPCGVEGTIGFTDLTKSKVEIRI